MFGYEDELQEKIENLKRENKVLQAKIIEFYKILEQSRTIESREGLEAEYWANEYFKHFDLKIQTEGKI